MLSYCSIIVKLAFMITLLLTIKFMCVGMLHLFLLLCNCHVEEHTEYPLCLDIWTVWCHQWLVSDSIRGSYLQSSKGHIDALAPGVFSRGAPSAAHRDHRLFCLQLLSFTYREQEQPGHPDTETLCPKQVPIFSVTL